MNLFEIYDAAVESYKINDLPFEFNEKFIQEYARGAFDEEYVSDENAAIIMQAHQNWLESDKGSHNFDTLVKFVLEAIEI